MNDINPIERIKELCLARNWSYYKLAKASDIPYSTLNTLMNSDNMPTLPTLIKICDGFGITLAEFLEPETYHNSLTTKQSECLNLFTTLSASDKELALAFMKGLHHQL